MFFFLTLCFYFPPLIVLNRILQKSKCKMQIKYTKEKNEIALKRTHVTKHKADDVKMMMTMPLLDGWCTVS